MVVIVGKDAILTGIAEFMPDGLPLVELDGLGDKRVIETLHRIRMHVHMKSRHPTEARHQRPVYCLLKSTNLKYRRRSKTRCQPKEDKVPAILITSSYQ